MVIENFVRFLLISLFSTRALAHGISETDKAAMLDGGYLEYLRLGASHMLTGYDHLLFIFGVIFFLTGFKSILKYITLFTVGHSLTLILATIFKITANYYLVDAVIAMSVCYKGFENIDGFKKYLGIKSPNLMWVIFSFGLVHGFGLSTRLQQLPLGETGLVMRILSFNVGVEIGQVVALLLMVGLISQWRKQKSFKTFSLVSNYGLILAGLFLFLMQMHGYQHVRYPDDFGFSQDNHHHAHENMNSMEHGNSPEHDHGNSHEHGNEHSNENGHEDGHEHSGKAGDEHSHEDFYEPGGGHNHNEGHEHGTESDHSHGKGQGIDDGVQGKNQASKKGPDSKSKPSESSKQHLHGDENKSGKAHVHGSDDGATHGHDHSH